MTSPHIKSPCVRNCCLNDDDICVGCYRTLQEITQWSEASDLDKLETLALAVQRASMRKEALEKLNAQHFLSPLPPIKRY